MIFYSYGLLVNILRYSYIHEKRFRELPIYRLTMITCSHCPKMNEKKMKVPIQLPSIARTLSDAKKNLDNNSFLGPHSVLNWI